MSCPNRGRPCTLHDQHVSWKFDEAKRDRKSAGWLVLVLVVVIALSTLPGLN